MKHLQALALACVGMTMGVATCAESGPSEATIKAGRALFDERCKTVAGQKIYRTVEDVEGIVLLKLRPKRTEVDFSDRDWPGAAFAKEYTEDEYITTFLGYEHSPSQKKEPVSPQRRGYINTDYQPDNPSNLPGYRYVDVVDEKTGARWRYSGYYDRPWEREPTHYIKDPYAFWKLKREPAPKDGPRYGVTFEDHVIPAERALGVASSTVKVIDLQTQEVLGEFTRYAWTPGVLFKGPQQPASPWLSAYSCGDLFVWGAGTKTRLFVDQVLKVGKEK